MPRNIPKQGNICYIGFRLQSEARGVHASLYFCNRNSSEIMKYWIWYSSTIFWHFSIYALLYLVFLWNKLCLWVKFLTYNKTLLYNLVNSTPIIMSLILQFTSAFSWCSHSYIYTHIQFYVCIFQMLYKNRTHIVNIVLIRSNASNTWPSLPQPHFCRKLVDVHRSIDE